MKTENLVLTYIPWAPPLFIHATQTKSEGDLTSRLDKEIASFSSILILSYHHLHMTTSGPRSIFSSPWFIATPPLPSGKVCREIIQYVILEITG